MKKSYCIYSLSIALFFMSHTNCLTSLDKNPSQKTLRQIIAEKKNQLNVPNEDGTIKSSTSFNFQFTPEEHEDFKTLHIKNVQPYNAYGRIEGNETNIENTISEYITSLGNDEDKARRIAQAITRISKEILDGFDAQAAWITLRASHPNHQYDIPRWHTDGYFYPPHEGKIYKVIITLQGPGTLLSQVTTETRNEYRKRDLEGLQEIKRLYSHLSPREQSIKHSNENRELFLSLFPQENVQQAATLEGTIIIAGDKDTATFHSEPRIDTYRLFMSVVPGTIEQIEHWCSKQK